MSIHIKRRTSGWTEVSINSLDDEFNTIQNALDSMARRRKERSNQALDKIDQVEEKIMEVKKAPVRRRNTFTDLHKMFSEINQIEEEEKARRRANSRKEPVKVNPKIRRNSTFEIKSTPSSPSFAKEPVSLGTFSSELRTSTSSLIEQFEQKINSPAPSAKFTQKNTNNLDESPRPLAPAPVKRTFGSSILNRMKIFETNTAKVQDKAPKGPIIVAANDALSTR